MELERLAEIVKFVDHKKRSDDLDYERLRGMTSEIIDAYAHRTERDVDHLRRLIAEHGALKNDDVIETGRFTIRAAQEELRVLHNGRVR